MKMMLEMRLMGGNYVKVPVLDLAEHEKALGDLLGELADVLDMEHMDAVQIILTNDQKEYLLTLS